MTNTPDLGSPVDLTEDESAALVKALVHGATHTPQYADGVPEEILLAEYERFRDEVISARVTLAALRLMVDGQLDAWRTEAGGDWFYRLREQGPAEHPEKSR